MDTGTHLTKKTTCLHLTSVKTRNIIVNYSDTDVLGMIYDTFSVLLNRQRKNGLKASLKFELSPKETQFFIGKKIPSILHVKLAEKGAKFTLLTKKGNLVITDLSKLITFFGAIGLKYDGSSLRIEHRGKSQEFIEVKHINQVNFSVNTYIFTGDRLILVKPPRPDAPPLVTKLLYLSKLFRRVFLVEGESDEAILRVFMEKLGIKEDVVFLWLNGKDNLTEILKRTPLPPNVLAIVDNEYPQESPNIHKWKRGEIEDYLLVPEAISKLLNKKGIDADGDELEKELQRLRGAKGSAVLKEIFKKYGLNYLKVRDGPRLAECISKKDIDEEIVEVIKFAYAQNF